MSAHNGDRARYHRFRNRKLHRRQVRHELRKKLLGQGSASAPHEKER